MVLKTNHQLETPEVPLTANADDNVAIDHLDPIKICKKHIKTWQKLFILLKTLKIVNCIYIYIYVYCN